MLFNKHLEFEGTHSFLSPSKYHWINYDDEKLLTVFDKHENARLGTRLHAFAHEAIQLKRIQPRGSDSLNRYINDAIRFRMTSEQMLFYSPSAYGTADSICFRKRKLRIHDLKTGDTPASVHQLEVLAALFCLEYDMDPETIEIELRIYQSDQVDIYEADPKVVLAIMKKIIHFDNLIAARKESFGE